MAERIEEAVLGGGCFWCLEAVYLEVEGVREVQSGYAGGRRPNPSYEQVCTGVTGHAEVVRVRYDPEVISYEDLLRIFFSIHDPTTLNRQGADRGTQYRSAIFYASDEQRRRAQAVADEVAAEGIYDAPIVTTLEPLETFWPAEPYHADYFRRNPGQGYCQIVVGPNVAKFRKKFADRLKGAR
jgi:peptide-methionine (S)-S-oxide reductase